VDRDVLKVEGVGQGGAQLDRDGRGLLFAGVQEQNRELVPAQAYEQVTVP